MSDHGGSRSLDVAIAALRSDLVAPDGPRISTMRNYNFAILPYPPASEFELRHGIRRLVDDLRAEGWDVKDLSLHELLLKRLRNLGEDVLKSRMERERRLFAKDPVRAMNDLRDFLSRHIEGPEGLVKDVVQRLNEFLDSRGGRTEKALVLIGRAGALYPFFRSSALLKHLDGQTRNVPVVLLYPGERRDEHALKFMGELASDGDYRPRIYP